MHLTVLYISVASEYGMGCHRLPPNAQKVRIRLIDKLLPLDDNYTTPMNVCTGSNDYES